MNAALKLWGSVGLAALVIAGATGGFLSWHKAQRAKQLLLEEDAEFQAEVPVSVRELLKTTTLPVSGAGLELGDCPNVLLNRAGIFLDGQRLAALPALDLPPGAGELFDALEASSARWKAQHSPKEFDGVVQFWVDESLSALPFNKAIQTAAVAGYPNARLVTRSRSEPRQLMGLPIDPQAPRPKEPPDVEPIVLEVLLQSDDRAVVSWSSAMLADAKPVGVKELSAAVTEAWKNRPDDALLGRFPQALLLIPREMRVGQLARVVDAILAPRVSPAPHARPVLFVTLSMRTPDSYPAGVHPSHEERPKIRMGATAVSGRLDPAVIQEQVRTAFPVFRSCYEAGLVRDPHLTGTATVRFVIGRDGRVNSAEPSPSSTLPDIEAQRCVARAFEKLVFPQPEGGIVTVVYPIALTPG